MSGAAAAKARQDTSSGAPQRRAESLSPQAMPGSHAELLGLQQNAGNRAVHELLQGGIPPVVQSVIGGGGQPLEPGLRTYMESRFGEDFSQVRIHTDSRAADSAEAVNAKAYTVGKDVVFGPGRYAPETGEGKRLLAHELAHVVQQGQGGGPVGGLSAEADAGCAAESIGSGGQAVITGSVATSVQRDAMSEAEIQQCLRDENDAKLKLRLWEIEQEIRLDPLCPNLYVEQTQVSVALSLILPLKKKNKQIELVSGRSLQDLLKVDPPIQPTPPNRIPQTAPIVDKNAQNIIDKMITTDLGILRQGTNETGRISKSFRLNSKRLLGENWVLGKTIIFRRIN